MPLVHGTPAVKANMAAEAATAAKAVGTARAAKHLRGKMHTLNMLTLICLVRTCPSSLGISKYAEILSVQSKISKLSEYTGHLLWQWQMGSFIRILNK